MSTPKKQPPNQVSFRAVWLSMSVEQREELAEKVGAKYRYLQHFAGGFRTPSLRLCRRMSEHIPGLGMGSFDDAVKMAGNRGYKRGVV